MKKVKELCTQWFEFEEWEDRVKALSLPYYQNPVTDNDRMINSQYAYIVSRFQDKKAEADLWLEGHKMCQNLLRRESVRKSLHYCREDEDIIAGIAVDYVLRRYKIALDRNNQIYFVKNFVCQFEKAVIHALHAESQDDMLQVAINIDDFDNYDFDAVIEDFT